MTPIYDAVVRRHGRNPAPDHATDADLAAIVHGQHRRAEP